VEVGQAVILFGGAAHGICATVGRGISHLNSQLKKKKK